MKTGQFRCLGNLQHLKNRFSKGYEVQIKICHHVDVNRVKNLLTEQLPGIEILGKSWLRIMRKFIRPFRSTQRTIFL